MRKLSVCFVLCTVFIAFNGTAAPNKKQKSGKQAGVGGAIQKLKSENPEEVINSIQILAAAGTKKAVAPLTELLRTGPRNDITDIIIQAIGSIGDESSIDILIEYLNHRRSDTRIAAIYALENFDNTRVSKALEDCLRDSDRQVRNTAALALGKRGSLGSVSILFLAFDRGVHDAAISIGQLGTPDHANRLAHYLGKADVKVLLPGFDEFLRREDFPEKAKLDILDQLFELAGPYVRRFAVAYKASFPQGTDEDENVLYKRVCRMVRQIQEE
ncbi:MAG: HEAT repeat domain-containing protein [Proteobacteria bacterium]|nr:HEAT repeat domain-containing protein [Pseudomonadota bacterium]